MDRAQEKDRLLQAVPISLGEEKPLDHATGESSAVDGVDAMDPGVSRFGILAVVSP
jgi:hypothetical protein